MRTAEPAGRARWRCRAGCAPPARAPSGCRRPAPGAGVSRSIVTPWRRRRRRQGLDGLVDQLGQVERHAFEVEAGRPRCGPAGTGRRRARPAPRRRAASSAGSAPGRAPRRRPAPRPRPAARSAACAGRGRCSTASPGAPPRSPWRSRSIVSRRSVSSSTARATWPSSSARRTPVRAVRSPASMRRTDASSARTSRPSGPDAIRIEHRRQHAGQGEHGDASSRSRRRRAPSGRPAPGRRRRRRGASRTSSSAAGGAASGCAGRRGAAPSRRRRRAPTSTIAAIAVATGRSATRSDQDIAITARTGSRRRAPW